MRFSHWNIKNYIYRYMKNKERKATNLSKKKLHSDDDNYIYTYIKTHTKNERQMQLLLTLYFGLFEYFKLEMNEEY